MEAKEALSSAEAVARYLVYLASQDVEPTPVTHLQVQKLLYYCQGWCLARHNRTLFDARIEAWTHGPVVPPVYPKFADYGSKPLCASEGRDGSELAAADRDLVEWIWTGYGRFTPWHLREMTHREPPWRDARKGTPGGEASKAEISIDALRIFFKGLDAARYEKFGMSKDKLDRSIQQAARKEGQPL